MSVSEASEYITPSERVSDFQFFADDEEDVSFTEMVEQTADEMQPDDDTDSDGGEDTDPSDETDSPDTDPDDQPDETPEDESGDQPEASDEEQTDETGDENDEGEEGEEPRIPKSRLDEVIDQRDELRDKVKSYAQTIRQYQNNPEKARELVEDYVNRGLIDPGEFVEGEPTPSGDADSNEAPQSKQDLMSRLTEVFPEQSAQVIAEAVENYTSNVADTGQQQSDRAAQQNPDQPGRNPQIVQQETEATIETMRTNEERFPHFEDVFLEPVEENEMGNPVTRADKVALNNPEEFVLEDVQYQTEDGEYVKAYDPEKLEELYFRAVAQTDFVDQKVQEAQTQGKQEGKQEVEEKLEENSRNAPEEPAGGTNPSGPTQRPEDVESFEDAFEMAEEQLA